MVSDNNEKILYWDTVVLKENVHQAMIIIMIILLMIIMIASCIVCICLRMRVSVQNEVKILSKYTRAVPKCRIIALYH